MANPEHTPEMEGLDYLTVAWYRVGLTIFAISIALHALEELIGWVVLGEWFLPLVGLSAASASANMHLYDPRFRWFVPLMSWIAFALLLFVLNAAGAVREIGSLIGLGFFYAGMGMLAVKESFCFKIWGLPMVPFLLAGAILLRLGGANLIAAICLAVAALLYLWMVIAKWRMPLHFDIGDKSAYRM